MKSEIERFAAGAELLHRVIDGLTDAELNAPPPKGSPGTWTLKQIVVHTMDSDLIGAHRMKRIIAEEKPPLLIGYDETAFAVGLFYEQMDARLAADLYRANRLMLVEILRRLPEEAFSRWGVHNESGRVVLGGLVTGYADHAEHHVRFAREKRRLMGRPME
ncbi:MAG: DinB family protein [Phycisphaerae bacterium]|nr:DinB family protein [Phycisphaerae bacterium]